MSINSVSLGGGGNDPSILRASAGVPATYIASNKGYLIKGNYTGRTAVGDNLAWTQAVTGSGALTDMVGSSTFNSGINQRAIQLTTGVTSTGRALIYNYGLTTDGMAMDPNTDMAMYKRVYIPDLSDASNEYLLELGIGNQFNSTAFSKFVGFVYDRTSNTNWLARCVDTTTTSEDTSVAVAADTWVELFWHYVAADTSVYFYINGSLVATITTNIPADTTISMHWVDRITKSVGTTSRDVFLSGFQWEFYDAS